MLLACLLLCPLSRSCGICMTQLCGSTLSCLPSRRQQALSEHHTCRDHAMPHATLNRQHTGLPLGGHVCIEIHRGMLEGYIYVRICLCCCCLLHACHLAMHHLPQCADSLLCKSCNPAVPLAAKISAVLPCMSCDRSHRTILHQGWLPTGSDAPCDVEPHHQSIFPQHLGATQWR